MLKHFTDANFQADVIEASKAKPVVVDFFASWCGPCQIQGPIVEELAEELKDQAIIGKLDTEEALATAKSYGIMSIPTLMVFRNGEPAGSLIGLHYKDDIQAEIKKHL